MNGLSRSNSSPNLIELQEHPKTAFIQEEDILMQADRIKWQAYALLGQVNKRPPEGDEACLKIQQEAWRIAQSSTEKLDEYIDNLEAFSSLNPVQAELNTAPDGIMATHDIWARDVETWSVVHKIVQKCRNLMNLSH